MKKHLVKYDMFVFEGGHSFDNVIGIKQSDVKETLEHFQKDVLLKLGLEGLDIDCALLGSAGKKANITDLSGDLDVAVSVDKIASAGNISFEEVLDYLDTKVQALGYKTQVARGFEQVSVAYPINGSKQEGFVQIDLMLSTSLEWSKFMYHSPDYRKAESKYKGLFRNILFMCAIKSADKKVVKYTDDNNVEEVEGLVVRLNQGVFKVRKSFMGKKGLVKIPTLLKDHDKFISNVPDEIVSNLLGDKFKPKDIDTFEKLYDIIFHQDSKLKSIRADVLKSFEDDLMRAKLPKPSEISQ